MGRPTILKKGAMTAAERQRRRRKKTARAGKAAEREAKQARNAEKYSTRRQEQEPVEWTSVAQMPLLSPIEELVAQVADAMLLDEIDANEFRAAFDKRFPV